MDTSNNNQSVMDSSFTLGCWVIIRIHAYKICYRVVGAGKFYGDALYSADAVFAKNILHGGSHTFGFLMGAAGIGALFGSITWLHGKC